MGFEFRRENYRLDPERQMAQAESRDRADLNSLEASSADYARNAQQIMEGQYGVAARDEIGRYAKKIHSSTGPEQVDELEKLIHALNVRKPAIFETVPNDEHERRAFALALVHAHEKSLQ